MFIIEPKPNQIDLTSDHKKLVPVQHIADRLNLESAAGSRCDDNNVSKSSSHPDFSVLCGRCGVPLMGRDQFLGHMVLSHEAQLRHAKLEWGRLNSSFFHGVGEAS